MPQRHQAGSDAAATATILSSGQPELGNSNYYPTKNETRLNIVFKSPGISSSTNSIDYKNIAIFVIY